MFFVASVQKFVDKISERPDDNIWVAFRIRRTAPDDEDLSDVELNPATRAEVDVSSC